jgi:hypothetical protein
MSHLPAVVLIPLVTFVAGVSRRRRRRRGHRHSLFYALYLRSPIWRARRRIWILQARGRCQDCGWWWGRQLTIHHLTYQRLGYEGRQDVRVLCWPCHQVRHHQNPSGAPSKHRRDDTRGQTSRRDQRRR